MLRLKMFFPIFVMGFVASSAAGPSTESYKGQYCTDPRTMLQHPAYTEWADAYSCTRHRCQPGGRNLAIYTVGCKRVEAPESAIECEEVVEDTNMQFPFCCTRLRCLVVVRGEVWTRVLGQPWETLPAAPWSHMYKMKRPPPGAAELPSSKPVQVSEGPVYELAQPEDDGKKEMRSTQNNKFDEKPRAATPDIVIALTTNNDKKDPPRKIPDTRSRYHKRGRKHISTLLSQDTTEHPNEEEDEAQNTQPEKEKQPEPPTRTEPRSEEQDNVENSNSYGVAQRSKNDEQLQQQTEVPQDQWNVFEKESPDPITPQKEPHTSNSIVGEAEKAEAEKSGNLQALVDAIGTRMRDIEHVVRRMTDKVSYKSPQEGAADETQDAETNKPPPEPESPESQTQLLHTKKPHGDTDYRRFATRAHNKYQQPALEGTTESPLYVEDSNLGFFSDASNAVLRHPPKEPAATYMAPVETRRSSHPLTVSDDSNEEKKKKKHLHKKKKAKGHHKKHHIKDDKKKRFSKLNSVETDKKTSLEDSNSRIDN